MRIEGRVFAAIGIVVIALTAQGQTSSKQSTRSRAQETKEQPATAQPSLVAPAPTPTGPTGVGGLKLGMTKEAVTALPEDDPVRLLGDLTTAEVKTSLPAGTERFNGKLQISEQVLDTTLTFRDGKLQGVSLSSKNDALLEGLVRGITEKYGPGVVKDERREEQCIYRNGN